MCPEEVTRPKETAPHRGLEPRRRYRTNLIVPRGIGEARFQKVKADPGLRRKTFPNLRDLLPLAKVPPEVWHDIGLSSREQIRYSRSIEGFKGYYSDLDALTCSVASFVDESDERAARERLGDEYLFVRDFELSVGRLGLDDGAAAGVDYRPPTERQWPEESGVQAAHDGNVLGQGVLVGVLDSGVDADHAEFSGRVVDFRHVPLGGESSVDPSRDVRGFDTIGHGTHACGILCGQNVGVAPEVKLFAVSVMGSESLRTSMSRVVAGLEWLSRRFSEADIERPAVLSLSLGFNPAEVPPEDEVYFESRVEIFRELLKALVSWNVLPIVATGNSGQGNLCYPGALEEVLGVGAVEFNGTAYNDSSYGSAKAGGRSKPDLVGYGVGVLSSWERNYGGDSGYRRKTGTSMATPYVAGIAALYRSREPGMGVQEAWDRLVGNARRLGLPAEQQGAGLACFA